MASASKHKQTLDINIHDGPHIVNNELINTITRIILALNGWQIFEAMLSSIWPQHGIPGGQADPGDAVPQDAPPLATVIVGLTDLMCQSGESSWAASQSLESTS